MRNLIFAGAAALAMAATPVMANDQMGDDHAYDMTEAQQKMFLDWPDDKRIEYKRWPADLQEYYWTLTPEQVEGWWVLNDDQRMMVYNMPPERRAAAWTQISAQLNNAGAQANASTTTRANTTTTSGNIRFVRNEHVQDTPGDEGPPTGDLPICSPNEEDNCINAWEAGKRGPGVTKPLDYWPGD